MRKQAATTLIALLLVLCVGTGAGLPARASIARAQSASASADTAVAARSVSPTDTSVVDSDTSGVGRAATLLVTRAERATPETVAVAPEGSVPVFLGGRELLRVRTGRDGLTPLERANTIRSRLSVAVGRRDLPADSVRMLSTPQGIEVRLGDQFLWLITPADAEGVSAAAVAREIAELPDRLRAGILKERAGRRPLGVLIAVLIAVGITLVALVLVRVLLILNRRWRTWLSATLPRHVPGVRVRGFEILSRAQVGGALGAILARLDVVVGLLLFYVYVTLVLSLFPWTQGWSWRLFSFATGALLEVARRMAGAVPGLLIVAVILMLFRWLAKLSDRFFDSVGDETVTIGGFHPELAKPSKRLVRIALWIVAVIVAYPYIPGADSKAVQGVSLLIGVMLSIGSTSFVGNVISGIVLTYSRSFRVGDRVGIGEVVGDVTSQGFFATKIRTIRNEEVTLPNGQVAAGAIVNYTRLAAEHGLILHTEVTIGYDAEWRTVHALLIEAAERVEGIEKEPKPWVFQRALNDYHVSYELNCMTRLSHPQLELYSGLHQEIQDAFARAGIEILSPAFHALRDANTAALPRKPDGPRAKPGGFRVQPPGS
jgi:small-conductance mechanosensitive channel